MEGCRDHNEVDLPDRMDIPEEEIQRRRPVCCNGRNKGWAQKHLTKSLSVAIQYEYIRK